MKAVVQTCKPTVGAYTQSALRNHLTLCLDLLISGSTHA